MIKSFFQIILYNIIFFSIIYVIINFNTIYMDISYRLFSNDQTNELSINENLNNIKQPTFTLFKTEWKTNEYLSFPWKKEMESWINLLKSLAINENSNFSNDKTINNIDNNINNISKKEKVGNKEDILDLTTDLSEEEWKKYWNNSYIYIPTLNIEAPIMFPSIEEYDLEWRILKLLEKWVVHRPETQKPDQRGNFFLIWHSSNYPWIKSQYNNIFAKIPKLKKWDKVYIFYKWRKFTYEMYTKFVVPSTALEVYWYIPWYNLSLMTCYPIWTDKNRMIVRFHLLK